MDTNKLISGRKLAALEKQKIKEKVEKLPRAPALAVILVGDNEASHLYVRSKEKYALEVGIKTELFEFDGTTSANTLISLIEELNENKNIDGILVQLPLPKHLKPEEILFHISPFKDVDGLHPVNRGKLMLKNQGIVPCTPKGCLKMIKSTGISLEGKVAVVVGRSLLVGNPMAQILLRENCSVIQAHSHTKDLGSLTKQADILVSAVGQLNLIKADMVKEGAIVIDVGMNRGKDGKLQGDVVFEEVLPKVSYISPVPGGVGPMTISMLFQNTLECAAFFLPHLSDVIKTEE